VILLVLAIVIPAWIWAWRQSRRAAWIAAYGVAWYVISLLPSAVLLAPDYVLGSPRLMLIASMGGSLFWAILAVIVDVKLPTVLTWAAAAQTALVRCP
jgi:hypothetical protein